MFEVIQNFPKRILNCGKFVFEELSGYESVHDLINVVRGAASIQTIAEAGLQNREVLFISDLDA